MMIIVLMHSNQCGHFGMSYPFDWMQRLEKEEEGEEEEK